MAKNLVKYVLLNSNETSCLNRLRVNVRHKCKRVCKIESINTYPLRESRKSKIFYKDSLHRHIHFHAKMQLSTRVHTEA